MTVDAFVVDPVAPARLSMSFLRSAEGCLRRAHMEREVDLAGGDALVGRLFHEVAAAVGFSCVIAGRQWMTFDEARPLAVAVMGRATEGTLPKAAWDQVLSLTSRWCDTGRPPFRPGELFEVLSVVEFDGRRLSARIDRVAVDGATAHVHDYKTGWSDPVGDLSAQGEMYAWHVLTSHPELDQVVYTEQHVRLGVEGGPWLIDRDDLDRTEEWLAAMIARVDGAYGAGTFPATPGSACSSPSRCPVAGSCPIPRWARPATLIETEADAVAQFEALLAEEALIADRKDRIRGWLEHTGERALQLHGEEIGRSTTPGKRFNRRRLADDLAASGAPVDLDAYEDPAAPAFGRRKAKAAA